MHGNSLFPCSKLLVPVDLMIIFMLNTTQSYFKKLYIVLSDRCEYSDDAPENP